MFPWLEPFDMLRWQPLVFGLLHSLWIGVIVAGVLALVLRWMPTPWAPGRYAAAMLAQVVVLMSAVVVAVCLGSPVWEQPSLSSQPAPLNQSQVVRPGDAPVVTIPTLAEGAVADSRDAELPLALPNAWTGYVAWFYLAGVTLMLLRMAWAVADAGRLVRQGIPADERTSNLVDRLRREIGIGRKVRVVVSQVCDSPAVAGVLWPTLVLPVALLTELSPEAIRAILLHELAHIRRHDYLLNLGQMLIEAVLFFNPAIWWMSRQIRIEREACCDALAVKYMGEPVVYSRALADWADRRKGSTSRDMAPIAAMGIGVHRRRTLLGRLRRVLLPGEKPEVHISPATLLGLLLLAALGMALVWQGTTVAVAVAAEIVSPAERVKQIAEQVEDHAPMLAGDEPVTFSGTIRTEDGGPLPQRMWGTRQTRSGRSTAISSIGDLDPKFKITAKPGVTWIIVHSEEYAAGVAGPFDGRSGKSFDEVEIVLTKGFPVEFTVQDEAGSPVAGATVIAGYIVGSGSSHAQKGESDAQGKGVLPHALEGDHFVTAKAPGYQDTGSTRMKVKRGERLAIGMRKALSVTGQVVTADGTPIAGAVLQEFVTVGGGGGSSHNHGPYGGKLATTDEEGRFTLDQLVSDNIYHLLVSHAEHGKRVHQGVRPGEQGLQVVLGPDITLEGTLQGDLSKLPQRRGEPYLRFRQEVPVGPENIRGWNGDEVMVERTETGGKFTLSGLLPAETTLTAGEHQVTVDLIEPTSQVTIDLNETVPVTETRQIELTFEADNSAPPRGSVRVYSPGFRNGELSDLPIVDGQVQLEVAMGADLYVRPLGVIGYWFKDRHFPVEVGEGPQRVRLETFPAGAISGQVLLANGKPDPEIQVSIRAVDKPEELKSQTITHSSSQRVDSQGRFLLTPLPLGGKYVVIAQKRHNKTVSDLVHLTESEPTGEAQLSFSPDSSASGTVVGPDGQPLADIRLKLELRHPLASTTWGPGLTTDRNGRFQIDGLSSTLDGYEICLATTKDYQPQSIPVNPGGPPVTMKLKQGHVLECAVLDAETGKAIPGVELYAYPLDRRADEPYAYEAEGKTSENGTTRFSNLSGREFQINDRNGLTWDKEKGKIHVPSQNKPLVIEATLPEWSRLKLP